LKIDIMHNKTLAELARDLKARKFSSEELARAYLARIERFNPELNAFITVLQEQALAAARAADQRIAKGEAGPLTGLPIAQKDIFCTQGVKTVSTSFHASSKSRLMSARTFCAFR
jgi:aspartyl-tRNA(Asn)/glutamyl-tRNA(Gln) amidotransferase subunit A